VPGELTREQITLAQRLRALREDEWPDVELTQAQLGTALGGDRPLSVPAISSWESQTNPKVPPQHRLVAYARFFATRRSVEGDAPRLLDASELTDEERERWAEIEAELTALRTAALGRPALSAVAAPPPRRGGTWRFADGKPVTIICAELPKSEQAKMPDSHPSSPDYVEHYAYADLDALIELHGHIRAFNPENQVNIRLASALTADDFSTHLVVLGGVDWNNATRAVLQRLHLPVRQVSDDDRAHKAYFEVTDDHHRVKHRPVVNEEDGRVVLLEDVGHFYRGVSPFNAKRTVTICNAMYGRGTLGVARALTDINFRDRNESFLAERFHGHQAFSVLMRVLIVEGQTVTPDWTLSEMRLHTWPQVAE
jgi:hypothetical protein